MNHEYKLSAGAQNILIWFFPLHFLILPCGDFSHQFWYFLLHDILSMPKKNQVFNFITLDYKHKFYFWDFFIFLTKFIIVFLTFLISSLEDSSQGALLIFTYFLFRKGLKPYNYEFINNLKILSYITIICSVAFAIMASNKESSDEQTFIFIFLSVWSTFTFYLAWLVYFVKVKREKLKESPTKEICRPS